MKKKKLDEIETSPKHIAKAPDYPTPVLVNWSNADTLKKLEALVEEHGVIYVPTSNGLPLKITRARLY